MASVLHRSATTWPCRWRDPASIPAPSSTTSGSASRPIFAAFWATDRQSVVAHESPRDCQVAKCGRGQEANPDLGRVSQAVRTVGQCACPRGRSRASASPPGAGELPAGWRGADDGYGVVGLDAGHGRQVADVPVHASEQASNRRLVRRDRIQIAHFSVRSRRSWATTSTGRGTPRI